MRYKLTFLDYWHLGSGLSAGAKVDSSVVKDADGIAYVPGKTLKGLLREMAELVDITFVSTCFGEEETQQGECYFSNATLEPSVHGYIRENHLQENLYDTLSSTKITENGIAENGSLREIEVVVPLVFYGEITYCKEPEKMEKTMKMLKRMGLNRNRGLGRCTFEVVGDAK